MSRRIHLIFLASMLISCGYPVGAQFDHISSDRLPANVTYSGDLASRHIDEASGLAVSRLNRRILWVINDSGGGPWLYAIDTSGRDMGRFLVNGAENYDWEDMASFELENTAYLLIADVGDNRRIRPFYTLFIIEEPPFNEIKSDRRTSVNLVRRIAFTYSDGPQDCESVAVDVENKRILLLTKRGNPPILYELPLHLQAETSAQMARPLTKMPDIYKPTGMDLSPDGASLAVLTYTSAFLFMRNPGENWSTALSRKPQQVNFPALAQQEAICFSHDGKSIFVTSEQFPAPLLCIDPNRR